MAILYKPDGTIYSSDSAVTAVGASGASVTLTIPAAGAGLFHYLTHVHITMYAAAALTPSATPNSVTTTNLPGSIAWTFPTAGAQGVVALIDETFNAAPIKSSVSNTATTIVCPAFTGAIWRVIVNYFSAA